MTEPNKYTIEEAKELNCGSCKFFFKTQGCMSCCNPKSQYKDQYRYWIFHCNHYEHGSGLSELEMSQLGYDASTEKVDYADGTFGEYKFYALKDDTKESN